MAQVKIYGIRESLNPKKAELSKTIHGCVMEALGLPAGKRAHRFFPMSAQDMLYPEGRSDHYTIIELRIIEGRSIEAKKKLVRLLFDRIESEVGIDPQDVEICISESPASNWGFRGLHGDEAKLNYRIDV